MKKFLIIIIFTISFFIGKHVFAYDLIADITQASSTGHLVPYRIYTSQTFTPVTNYLDAINVYMASSTYDIYVCQGTPPPSFEGQNSWCGNAGQSVLLHQTGTTTADGLIILNERLTLSLAGNYFIGLNNMNVYFSDAGSYAGGALYGSNTYGDVDAIHSLYPNYDLQFQLLHYDMPTPYYNDPDVLNFYSISGMNIGLINCCENQACDIPFSFDNTLSGSSMEYGVDIPACFPLSDGYSNPQTLDATNTLPRKLTLSPQTAGNHTLCVNVDGGSNPSSNSLSFLVYASTSPICEAASSTVSIENAVNSIFGEDIHSFVCTNDEWNSSDWWTNAKCQVFEATLTIMVRIAQPFGNFINLTASKATYFFPFNVGANVYNSWNNAATSTLPSNLSFLNIVDQNNDIKLTLPAAWFGTSTTMILFGDSVFKNSSDDLKNFFVHIRILSTYLLYVIFILGLYYRAYYYYDELKN